MREPVHSGAFLLSAPRSYQSYERESIGEGYDLPAGTLLARVDGALVPYSPIGVDGSEKPVAVLMGAIDTRDEVRQATLLVRGAEINALCLAWPEETTDEQKANALGWLVANSGLVPRGHSITPQGGAEPAGYIGPLDLVPETVVAYSATRALAASMLAQNGYTLINQAAASQSFAYDGTTGLIDSAAILTFLAGNPGYVTGAFDHSGEGNNGAPVNADTRPPWTADGGASNKPAFLTGIVPGTHAPRLVTDSFTISAGARSYVIALDYTENIASPEFMLSTHVGAATEEVICGAFWNEGNDLYLQITTDEGGVAWATSVTLTTGVHLLEFQIAANGDVTILIDGEDALATVVDGEQIALTQSEDCEVTMPSNSASPDGVSKVSFLEGFIAPQEDIGASARANIMTFYGIA